MAKAFDIQIKGLDKLTKKLNSLNLIDVLDDELTATALDIEREAKSAVPKDLSALANSIRSDVSKPLIKRNLVTVGYAAYQEFGTGGLVDVPSGLEEYAIQFKGQGKKQVNLPARPFLFPAFYSQTDLLIKRLKLVIEQELSK